MTVTELRPLIGTFGEIKMGEVGYKKTVNGWLKDMDTRGRTWVVDTEGWGYSFKASEIDYFVPKEFQPLPDEHNGKTVYYKEGRVYNKDNKEIDLKK